MKRTIKETYVSVEPFHLGRYLDEQSYRFNQRDRGDYGRFRDVLSSIFGKRLTYSELTGNGQAPSACPRLPVAASRVGVDIDRARRVFQWFVNLGLVWPEQIAGEGVIAFPRWPAYL